MMLDFSFARTLLFFIPVIALIHQASRIYKIFINYAMVKGLGYPIVIAPITWQDPVWLFIGDYLKWLQYFPYFSWVGYSYMGWSTMDKGRAHQKYGPIFLLVSPNRTEFFTSDPQMGSELAARWKVWIKDPNLYKIFDVFGKNVNTTNGEEWQRHRKIIGGAFRESAYGLVWEESRKQGQQMMQSITKRGKCSMEDFRNDIALLAMHVLSAASFGKGYDYGEGLKTTEDGHQMSYFKAMALILGDMMGAVVFGNLAVPDWILPGYYRSMKLGVSECKKYMSEALAEQREHGLSSDRHDLATQLLHANDIEKKEKVKSGGRAAYLTDEELFGNMFMFSFAGYETTAMSLCFTIPYLAIDPGLQHWVREEIEWVREAGGLQTYEDSFPKLKRCLALMYETLRLHSAVAHTPRLSPDTPTELWLPSIGKTLIIPPGSLVSIPLVVQHYDRATWGEDVLEYDPKRWIQTDEKGREILVLETDRVGYMPWLTGPRACPGKKFSQVEYVAVLSTIILSYDIKPAIFKTPTSKDEGVRQLRKAVNNAYHRITPTMKNPETCGVEFIARQR